jgi:hypothetical protein
MRYSFFLYLFSTFLILSFSLSIYNFYKDPYWFWTDKPNWKHSLSLDTKQRFIKPIKAIKYNADLLIIGSSRVYRGIDPDEFLKYGYKKPYNLGISSLKIYEMYHILKNHFKINHPKKIVIGLDYWMFNIDSLKEKDFKEDAIKQNYIYFYINNLIGSLLSYSAFKDSRKKTKDIESTEGSWKENGFHKTTKRETETSILMLDGYTSYLKDFNYKKISINFIEKIIKLCSKKNIELAIYISPIHFQTLLSYFNSKNFNKFNEWKESISLSCSKNNIHFIDFSNDFLKFFKTEPGTNWLDYSHFSPIIGNKIISKMIKN